ncbi:MAG: PKD domain-containing protein, partial [Promethearchaeota archaeon]
MFKPSSTYNKNKIRILLTCLIMISLSLILFNPNARAIEVKDNITFDTIWSAELSPYVITKNISIAREATLKIEAGAIIKFKEASGGSSGYHLKVNGTLDARGNDTDPILFTSEENGHYWGHIEFTQESTPWDEGSSSGCILNHCIIEYAGNGEAGDYGQTSVRTISASPLIKNNIIRYSYTDGIIAFSGIQNIADNRVHDTACAIKLLSSEGGVVENNYMIRNEQGIYVESGANTLEIRKNTVRNSSSEVFGGCLGVNLLYQDNLFSYLWEQIHGPDVNLTDPNGRPYSNDIRPTFTAPDVSNDESITFQLTVTDHGGLLSVDTVTVTVKGENKAPVANAGTDQTASEGSQVVLEGANSLDPDGGIESLSYKWEQTSGQNVILSNPNSVHCTFTAPTVGQYGETLIFQLMVTDSGGLQSKDTVNIHVTKEEVNEPPVAVASANPNQPITEGSPVTLNGSGSSDPENQIISWLWWQIEGSRVTISNPNAELASFTAPEVEWEGQSLVFELTVTDDAFQESKDRVVINVVNTDPNDRNSPPSADAGLDKEVDEGSDGSLNGTASDPDGASDIDTYQWAQISGPSVSLTGTGANRTFKAPNVTKDEELIFRLTVTDEQEMKSSDTIKVTVKWVNRPPVADADSDPETIEEGLRVLLDGSGSADEDDGIASYFWEQLTGTNVVLSGNDIVKPVFKAPDVSADEMLTFQLTVTDVSGESDSDFVIIYVVAENEAPVADAGLDQVVTEGAAVTLDGLDSYDPEDPNNGIISYLWEQSAGTIVTLYNATTPTPHFTAPQIEEDGNTPD